MSFDRCNNHLWWDFQRAVTKKTDEFSIIQRCWSCPPPHSAQKDSIRSASTFVRQKQRRRVSLLCAGAHALPWLPLLYMFRIPTRLFETPLEKHYTWVRQISNRLWRCSVIQLMEVLRSISIRRQLLVLDDVSSLFQKASSVLTFIRMCLFAE